MTLTPVQKELASIGLAFVALGITATAFASEVITVVQRDRNFLTRAVEVSVGDVVRFTNEDPYVHQLYTRSASFNFSSERQEQGKVLSVPFTVAGTFQVRCEIHPKMVLTVAVN
ncbi:MAG: methylamine utilization protein [Hyphomicrobiales bacterium]|nr:MAG: methylamine utilization protein [Hyphomicrobiales bacterium]